MTTIEIEKLAKSILEKSNILNPAVRADKIVEFNCDLEFEWRELKNNSTDGTILAAISFENKKIYLNETHEQELKNNLGRMNFTIAHELGHWLLHKDLAQEKLQGLEGEILICRGIDRQIDSKERQANLFATYLLMPEEFIRNEITKFKFDRNIIRKMAEKFCVSKQAMEIRLVKELKLVYKFNGGYYQSEIEAREAVGQLKLF